MKVLRDMKNAQQGICPRIKGSPGSAADRRGHCRAWLWTEKHVPCWGFLLVILITQSDRLPQVNAMHICNLF